MGHIDAPLGQSTGQKLGQFCPFMPGTVFGMHHPIGGQPSPGMPPGMFGGSGGAGGMHNISSGPHIGWTGHPLGSCDCGHCIGSPHMGMGAQVMGIGQPSES